MDMLKVNNGKIIDSSGKAIRLRGTGVGGWMSMENFMNSFPGSEHEIKELASDMLGGKKGKYIFDCMRKHFFTEDDVRYIKSTGANVIRIPVTTDISKVTVSLLSTWRLASSCLTGHLIGVKHMAFM